MATPQSRTVLIVDDDDLVVSLVAQVLRHYGYSTLVAAGGTEAVALAAARPGPIHLLVTDVDMPGMSGPEVAGRVRAVRPGVEVLYMSGGASNGVVVDECEGGRATFLGKPFQLTDLVALVGEALHKTPG